jgi:hypothetical protein
MTLMGTCLWLFDRSPAYFWTGRYVLEIRLTSKPDHEVAKVSAGALQGTKDDVDRLRRGVYSSDRMLKPLDWSANSVSTLEVWCGGKRSYLGRDLSYGEDNILALKVEFNDGKSEFRYFEIPPGHGRRSMTVEVP